MRFSLDELLSQLAALKTARKMVKESWTQGAFARDEKGRHCPTLSYEACSWCLSGAIKRSCYDVFAENEVVANDIRDCELFWRRKDQLDNLALSTLLHNRTVFMGDRILSTVIGWNDCAQRTQDEVLMLVDKMVDIVNRWIEEMKGENNGNAENAGHAAD